jgi:hypothetical protein
LVEHVLDEAFDVALGDYLLGHDAILACAPPSRKWRIYGGLGERPNARNIRIALCSGVARRDT